MVGPATLMSAGTSTSNNRRRISALEVGMRNAATTDRLSRQKHPDHQESSFLCVLGALW